MIAQLEPFIDFDPNYIRGEFDENRDYYLKSGQKVRPWSFGRFLDPCPWDHHD